MSWFNFFKNKPETFLGIDIGASAVKIVEIEKDDQRHKLKNYAIYSLEDYLKKNDYKAGELSKIPVQDMAKIIKATLKEAEIETKEAYFSVPVYSSFSTLIELPEMPEKEIASAIPFEARKYIPIPVSEVVLDWSKINSPDKKTGHQILIVAVSKKVIDYYNKVMKLAGLISKSIEEETFSLSRSLIGNDKSTILLIDAGARSINVSIIDNGYIRMTHNLELGGLKITKAIAEQMNYGMEKAEEAKKGISGINGNNSRIEGISHSILKIIIIEIKKLINSYQDKNNRKIEKIILVGNGAHLVGFVDYLKESFSSDISLGDPFARVDYPVILKPVIKELGAPLAVAVGLSMR